MPLRLARHPAAQFAILLLAALILRGDTFGDPNLHGDEVFYSVVGAAMHHGALPYVDVWDRKPFGLFAVFYLIAAISEAPLAYQLVAALCTAGTAWTIAAMARQWTNLQGGLLAGLAYLLWLAPLQGFGGQSPVFYNLLVALAAMLVSRALPALREGRVPTAVPLAMLLAGLGITIKTTVVAEAAFLGLAAAFALWRSPAGRGRALRHAALWMAIGAAPTLIIAAVYAAIGHWPEYWHAMVTANLSKPSYWLDARIRLTILFVFLSPILLIAAFGLVEQEARSRRFLLGWIVAAIVGLSLVPHFYLHYALPLLVPLCVAASRFLDRGALGFGAVAALAAMSFYLMPPFQYDHARQSRAAIAALAAAVRAHVGDGRLLTYDGPPQLYALTDQPFVTPLVFPTHLSHLVEKDVSHLSTIGETRRVLALRPGAVVMAVPIRNGPVNEETHRLVLDYVGAHCRLVSVVPTLERMRTDLIAVWGDCRKPKAAAASPADYD